MAVKRKNQKKQMKKELFEKAVKIKCCYCDSKGDCTFRQRKEQSERMGIVTYCTMTPNRPKSFIKKHKGR